MSLFECRQCRCRVFGLKMVEVKVHLLRLGFGA